MTPGLFDSSGHLLRWLTRSEFPPEVSVEGAIVRQSSLSREHHGARAVLNALERLANYGGPECDRIRQELGIADSQLRDYQARLGAPFLHDAYLSELTALRDQLKAGLSGKTPDPLRQSDSAPEPGSEPSSVSELAERIKALKAAHNIEATPQRVRQKQSSAEEPVTARIRRRTEAHPAFDPAIQADAPGPEASPPAKSNGHTIAEDQTLPVIPSDHTSTSRQGAPKPKMTFQQRLAMERQRKDPEPSLS